MYAETSYAGKPMFGRANPTPTHYQHIAAYLEHKRIVRIAQRARESRVSPRTIDELLRKK